MDVPIIARIVEITRKNCTEELSVIGQLLPGLSHAIFKYSTVCRYSTSAMMPRIKNTPPVERNKIPTILYSFKYFFSISYFKKLVYEFL